MVTFPVNSSMFLVETGWKALVVCPTNRRNHT